MVIDPLDRKAKCFFNFGESPAFCQFSLHPTKTALSNGIVESPSHWNSVSIYNVALMVVILKRCKSFRYWMAKSRWKKWYLWYCLDSSSLTFIHLACLFFYFSHFFVSKCENMQKQVSMDNQENKMNNHSVYKSANIVQMKTTQACKVKDWMRTMFVLQFVLAN